MTVPTKEEVLQRIREDFQKSGLSADNAAYTCFLEGWKCASLLYKEQIYRMMDDERKKLKKST